MTDVELDGRVTTLEESSQNGFNMIVYISLYVDSILCDNLLCVFKFQKPSLSLQY